MPLDYQSAFSPAAQHTVQTRDISSTRAIPPVRWWKYASIGFTPAEPCDISLGDSCFGSLMLLCFCSRLYTLERCFGRTMLGAYHTRCPRLD